MTKLDVLTDNVVSATFNKEIRKQHQTIGKMLGEALGIINLSLHQASRSEGLFEQATFRANLAAVQAVKEAINDRRLTFFILNKDPEAARLGTVTAGIYRGENDGQPSRGHSYGLILVPLELTKWSADQLAPLLQDLFIFLGSLDNSQILSQSGNIQELTKFPKTLTPISNDRGEPIERTLYLENYFPTTATTLSINPR